MSKTLSKATSKVNLCHQRDAEDEVEEADESNDQVLRLKELRELVHETAGARFKHSELKLADRIRYCESVRNKRN